MKKLPKVGEHFDNGYHVARIWEHDEWWDLLLMKDGNEGSFRALKTEYEKTPTNTPTMKKEETTLKLYPKYTWECELFGKGREIVLSVEKQPNWFWRAMQYLLIGNKWKKL